MSAERAPMELSPQYLFFPQTESQYNRTFPTVWCTLRKRERPAHCLRLHEHKSRCVRLRHESSVHSGSGVSLRAGVTLFSWCENLCVSCDCAWVSPTCGRLEVQAQDACCIHVRVGAASTSVHGPPAPYEAGSRPRRTRVCCERSGSSGRFQRARGQHPRVVREEVHVARRA